MMTQERAKKEIEKRRQEEQNMLRNMKKEIENYKNYWMVHLLELRKEDII